MRAFGLAAVLVLCTGGAASAQTLPSFDARTWRPSPDPEAGMVLEPTTTQEAWSWNVGATLHYSHHPVTLRDPATGDVVSRPLSAVLGSDLIAGIGLGAHASAGVTVPLFLVQDGTGGQPPTVTSTPNVPQTGIGDLGIHGKAEIIGNDGGGFGLAALGTVTMPTGERGSFMGDGSLSAGARLLAEYSLLVASAEASLGYVVRTDHHPWPDPSVGGVEMGDYVPWTIGVSLRPGAFKLDPSNRQRWDLAFHGWLPAGPVGPFGLGDPGSAALSPALLSLSDRIAIGHMRDVYALGGIDIGLDSAIGVPAFRVVIAVGWNPREHDMDHDGVADDVDQCPEIPEDKDGFEDSDGCPEIDNDDDGIIDSEDACPNLMGDPSPNPRKNGCPGVDSDGDGIPDDIDACPHTKGVRSNNPAKNGCPTGDRDGDGVADDLDKCPDKAGPIDGCPEPDGDGDGIIDRMDSCPKVPGEPSTDPARNGCPNPDRDGDTYENDRDQCPDAAEVFNGIRDDDGCPDEGGKPLVVIDAKGGVKLEPPIKIVGAADEPEVDKGSLMTLRALALELNRHRDWTLAVGVRPAGPASAQETAALARSFAVVHVLSTLTHRDGAAETVGWDAVRKQPFSDGGIGLLLLVATPPPAAPAPLPAAKGP
jgi:hypothetical protein